ncbi:acyl-CoA desaturase [uncultured Thalassospira sp.]|jgi:stearoyl-CoA desaturase (delta-9 desaturase)|uniref:acyl-CoA desaturase n=1 Tax=uncultured Thalassospira sp. TaxID=404382 RepID=UPI0030DC4730
MPVTTNAPAPETQPHHDDIIYPSLIPFSLAHLACFAAIWTGITWQAAVLGLVLYVVRMFGVTGGYHRYFSHRAFATSRFFQFVLAVLAQSSAQKSVLWWAAKHRHHHKYSDTVDDVHSPRHKGFVYSHVGWIFARKHDTADLSVVSDLTRYRELMWLHKFETAPAILLAIACFFIAGWSGLVVGFFWSTVACYHGTFGINSLAHVRGSTRYVTGDDSRNNWLLAIFTLGEGWHNNHHAYQSSARQGFRWWEYDPTYYALCLLSWVGLVRDLKQPPQQVLRNEQRLGTKVINRAAEQLAAHFDSDRIARAICNSLHGPELQNLQQALTNARDRTSDALNGLHLPHLPSRDEFMATARQMFAKTKSLDDIIDRAYDYFLASVGNRLAAVPVPAK